MRQLGWEGPASVGRWSGRDYVLMLRMFLRVVRTWGGWSRLWLFLSVLSESLREAARRTRTRDCGALERFRPCRSLYDDVGRMVSIAAVGLHVL